MKGKIRIPFWLHLSAFISFISCISILTYYMHIIWVIAVFTIHLCCLILYLDHFIFSNHHTESYKRNSENTK